MELSGRRDDCIALGEFTTSVITIPSTIDVGTVTAVESRYEAETTTVAVVELPPSDACSVGDLSASVAAEGRSGDLPSIRIDVTNDGGAACRVSDLRSASRIGEDGERWNAGFGTARFGYDAASVLIEPSDHATVTLTFGTAGVDLNCHLLPSTGIAIALAREPDELVVPFASDACPTEPLSASAFWQRTDPRG